MTFVGLTIQKMTRRGSGDKFYWPSLVCAGGKERRLHRALKRRRDAVLYAETVAGRHVRIFPPFAPLEVTALGDSQVRLLDPATGEVVDIGPAKEVTLEVLGLVEAST